MALVEPEHKMYLNVNPPANAPIVISVEPEHKMYLNSLLEIKKEDINNVEPEHKMYLNIISTDQVSKLC